MVNLKGIGLHLPWVYVHSSLCKKNIWCNGVAWIYAQWLIEWGPSVMGMCAFFSM